MAHRLTVARADPSCLGDPRSSPSRPYHRPPVSTRKLILLALVCGLAILLAGGIQLFTLRDQRLEVTALPVGTEAVVGGAGVTVLAGERRGDVLDVTVRVRAGDEAVADAWASWAVIAAGGPLERLEAGTCPPPTVEPGTARSCVLAFALGTSRPDGLTVVFRRADDTARWALGS